LPACAIAGAARVLPAAAPAAIASARRRPSPEFVLVVLMVLSSPFKCGFA
jgi:hypothetical protein